MSACTHAQPLAESAGAVIAQTLDARLANGLDLHSQREVAHGNMRGPLFPRLHPQFEHVAVQLAAHTDEKNAWFLRATLA